MVTPSITKKEKLGINTKEERATTPQRIPALIPRAFNLSLTALAFAEGIIWVEVRSGRARSDLRSPSPSTCFHRAVILKMP